MSWLELEGKCVAVTGGASGIGKAVCEEFLNQGCNVAVLDISPEAPTFESKTGTMKYYQADITDKKAVDATFAAVKDDLGRVDVLVNNAGINIPRLLVDPKDPGGEFELDEAVWNKVQTINLNGVFLCAQAAARQMIAGGGGVIINMSSESGLEGSEGQSVYAATKAAVNSLTRSWCKELGKYNIRVVGVAPGIMEATGLRTLAYESALAYTRGITVDELRAGYSKKSTTPMGRSGKLSEVANLCAFLASFRGGYIDGVTYNVAGGKTRG